MDLSKLSKDDRNKLLNKIDYRLNELSGIEQVAKLVMNIGYGASGDENFRYYDINIASSITAGGRYTINKAINKVDEYMNNLYNTDNLRYVIYSDTDSCFIKLPHTEPTLHEIESFYNEHIEKVVTDAFAEIATECGRSPVITFKREKIAERAFFTDKKKKYFVKLLKDEDEVVDGKISITGMESVRSDTAFVCRGWLAKCYGYIINEQYAELRAFIKQCKKDFFNLPMSEIGRPISYNKPEKEKPAWHIVAGNVYNEHFPKNKVRYGDKICVFELVAGNPFQCEKIGAPVDTNIPEIQKWISYKQMFYKQFEKKIETLLFFVNQTIEVQYEW